MSKAEENDLKIKWLKKHGVDVFSSPSWTSHRIIGENALSEWLDAAIVYSVVELEKRETKVDVIKELYSI